jgi:hypothetical protein
VLAHAFAALLQLASGLHVHWAVPAGPVQLWCGPQALPAFQPVHPLDSVTHVWSPAAPHCVLPALHCPAGHPHVPPPPAALHASETLEHEVHGLPPLPHTAGDVPAAHEVGLAQQPAHVPGPHARAQVIPSPV